MPRGASVRVTSRSADAWGVPHGASVRVVELRGLSECRHPGRGSWCKRQRGGAARLLVGVPALGRASRCKRPRVVELHDSSECRHPPGRGSWCKCPRVEPCDSSECPHSGAPHGASAELCDSSERRDPGRASWCERRSRATRRSVGSAPPGRASWCKRPRVTRTRTFLASARNCTCVIDLWCGSYKGRWWTCSRECKCERRTWANFAGKVHGGLGRRWTWLGTWGDG